MPLSAGTKFGFYEIQSPLGAGGMGEVYLAKQSSLGRQVAIKVLASSSASDPERMRRFEQEARSASALNHANIISIYDVGRENNTAYIAMEFVDGRTLRALMESATPNIKKALQIAAQIADGLAKAHAAGIVHRDLKPENIMLTKDGFVKILDFGLAKLMPGLDNSSQATIVTADSQPGAVVGTAPYTCLRSRLAAIRWTTAPTFLLNWLAVRLTSPTVGQMSFWYRQAGQHKDRFQSLAIGHGFLFCTASGQPLSPRNILRDSLHPTLLKLKQPKMGFHCFRRFRESVLQMSEARALLVDYWMGHENRDMGTRYAKQLVEDVAWRKQWAEKIGLGFNLTSPTPGVGKPGQLLESEARAAKAA